MTEHNKMRTSKNSTDLTWNKPRAHWLDVCTGTASGIPAENEGLDAALMLTFTWMTLPGTLAQAATINRQYLLCHHRDTHQKAGVLTLSIMGNLALLTLSVGACPVHCRMFSSTPSLYPPDASSNPPVVTTKMSLDIVKCSLRAKLFLVKNHMNTRYGNTGQEESTTFRISCPYVHIVDWWGEGRQTASQNQKWLQPHIQCAWEIIQLISRKLAFGLENDLDGLSERETFNCPSSPFTLHDQGNRTKITLSYST